MSTYDNYILQIVATGSLTKAAEALGISQPALSLGLNKLEKELGFGRLAASSKKKAIVF